jgi:hypothetical protein
MNNIDKLKLIRKEYRDDFDKNMKEWMKIKNKKKLGAYAQLVASLDLSIKFAEQFEHEGNNN